MNDRGDTPLIGIGASAGGLAALKRLFGGLRPGNGAAYAIVQHLDPRHESLMASLLARHSDLRVVEAEHGQTYEADTVYTTPAGKYLGIHDGRLQLSMPPQERFQRTPIDHLFRQIADRYGPRGVAVVLSGTGSDGTQGVRDIKAAGGLVLVQDPDDAEFNGMPRSALETGLVDVIARSADLAEHLHAVVERPQSIDPEQAPDYAARDAKSFRQILDLLAESAGYNFRHYKPGTLNRRIHRRMGLNRVETLEDYRRLLLNGDRERDVLAKDLLIGVTRFFRDQEAWEICAQQAIDPIIERLADGETLRAWVAGCATGEEAYTLAILLHERIGRARKRITPQVFATDLDASAIAVARAGRYPRSSVADLSPQRIERWFDIEDDKVKVVPDLRERMIFASQNAISDPPFSKLDLISCRNLLIYLDSEAQKRLIETFHFALTESGFLFLGLSESAERKRDLFETVDQRRRLYRRRPGATPGVPAARLDRSSIEPAPRQREPDRPASGLQEAAVRAMLQRFVPPAVLVSSDYAIRSFHGEIDSVLVFQRGQMTGNLIELVPEAWRARLSTALHTAWREDGEAETQVSWIEGDTARQISILVEPVPIGEGLRDFLVYFRQGLTAEVPAPAAPGTDDAEMSRLLSWYQAEVSALQHELQEGRERSETSNEELQAANEEVMSANEELQSSNEELETSREELQSLNEELTTINAELEEKVNELEATNDDLANLISSTDIATIFLDTDLCIRRFSARTQDLVSVRESDLGRPLSDLTLRVEDPALLDDARHVLQTLETREVDVEAETDFYLRRVTPYRTRTDHVQGVIVTYANVTRLRTASRRMERQARQQASIADLGELALASESVRPLLDRAASEIADHLDAPLVEVQLLDPDGKRFLLAAGIGWTPGIVGTLATPNTTESYLGYGLRRPPSVSIDDFDTETRFPRAQHLTDHNVRCGICQHIGPGTAPWGMVNAWRTDVCAFERDEINYLAAMSNILSLAVSQSETRRLRENQRAELKALIDGLPIMIGLVDPQMRLEISNRAFQRVGLTEEELTNAPLADVLGQETMETLRAEMSHNKDASGFSIEAPILLPAEPPRAFLIHCAPRLQNGVSRGHYLAAIDIQERKLWEERNRVISDELDHRVKNILALVNTIARMTGRNAGSLEEFREVFSSRIASLARTHSALAASNWTGIDLRQLVANELEAYAADALQQFQIDGPPVDLSMPASQSFALAVHELTTNAAKHGALSDPRGRLSVSWSQEPGALRIVWTESGLSDVAPPTQMGFGSSVVRSAAERQLGGRLDITYRPEGLHAEIVVPDENLKE